MRLCRDGTDALRAFENASFDLVILDVMMPRMDGFATCRELRTRGRNGSGDFSFRKGDIVDKGHWVRRWWGRLYDQALRPS